MRKFIYPKCKPLHEGIGEEKQQGWGTQNTAAKCTQAQKKNAKIHMFTIYIDSVMPAYEILITWKSSRRMHNTCKSCEEAKFGAIYFEKISFVFVSYFHF